LSIKSEQLHELTDRINDAFNEFERDGVPVFRELMPGQVRIILAAIDGWHGSHLRAEGMNRPPLTAEWQRGYEEGYAEALRTDEYGDAARAEAEDKRLGIGYVAVADNPHARPEGSRPLPTYGAVTSGVSANPDPAAANGYFYMPPPPALPTPPAVPRRSHPWRDMPRTLEEVDAVNNDTSSELDDRDSDEDGDEPEERTTKADLMSMRMPPEEKASILRECLAAMQDMAEGGVMPSMVAWNERKPEHLPKADTLLKRHDLTWRNLSEYAHLTWSGKPGPTGPRKPVNDVPTQAAE
jgi:hypothetical protein